MWSIHYSCQWLTLLPNAFAYFLCLHFPLMFYAPFWMASPMVCIPISINVLQTVQAVASFVQELAHTLLFG